MNKNIALLFTGLVLGFVVSSFASSEEKLSRQIDVRPGGKLVVDVDFGTIDVNAGTDDKVVIEAWRRVDFHDESAEKEYLAAVPVAISADGNSVTVRARAPKEARHHRFHHASMDGRYTIRVPRNFSSDLNTGGGSITANELTGEMRADSGGGELKFARLQGAVQARSGGGDIHLDECSDAIDIKTGGGDIVLRNGRGTLRARTGGGAIEVRNFTGDTDIATGGGELKLEKIDGRIAAETSGGSIEAAVAGTAKKINLETSGGSIALRLPNTAAADITAQATAGRITTDLPLQISSASDEYLQGKLNGGGPAIVLRTSGGSISVTSASPETAAR